MKRAFKVMAVVSLALVAALPLACQDGRGHHDEDASTDTGTDADADTDSDTDAETDSDTDALYWTDDNTGLVWQQEPDPKYFTWQEAIDHCDALDLGGYDDWRLPAISELRSLIRGCARTVTGGACGVTDECLDYTCFTDDCGPCEHLAGPGVGGCYWDAEVHGECEQHWSSSSQYFNLEMIPTAWCVRFFSGQVDPSDKVEITFHARCVRGGP